VPGAALAAAAAAAGARPRPSGSVKCTLRPARAGRGREAQAAVTVRRVGLGLGLGSRGLGLGFRRLGPLGPGPGLEVGLTRLAGADSPAACRLTERTPTPSHESRVRQGRDAQAARSGRQPAGLAGPGARGSCPRPPRARPGLAAAAAAVTMTVTAGAARRGLARTRARRCARRAR
jgi:hypothetical protein